MSDSGEGAFKNLGIFSTLQTATEVRFFLLSTTFVLLVDDVFVQLNQPSIFELVVSHELMAKSNLAIKAILIFVGFSFLTAVALPPLAFIFNNFYLAFISPIFDSFGALWKRLIKKDDNPPPARREHNCVRLYELRAEADNTKEKYFVDIYKEYADAQLKNKTALSEQALFSFFCMFMLCWNIKLDSAAKHTLSMVTANYLGSPICAWLAVLSLFWMATRIWHVPYEPNWVYCPSLYRKLAAAEEEAAKRIGQLIA